MAERPSATAPSDSSRDRQGPPGAGAASSAGAGPRRSSDFDKRPKRKCRRSHQPQQRKIRRKSRHLVNTGQVAEAPCVACGAQENLTIHHIEPMQADHFAFLCEPCHVRSHRPLYRKMSVPLAYGQFSILPEAAAPRKEGRRG